MEEKFTIVSTKTIIKRMFGMFLMVIAMSIYFMTTPMIAVPYENWGTVLNENIQSYVIFLILFVVGGLLQKRGVVKMKEDKEVYIRNALMICDLEEEVIEEMLIVYRKYIKQERVKRDGK